MREKLLNILTCPYHQNTSLNLAEIIKKSERQNDRIIDGILLCPDCKRWFAVIDGVPILSKDEIRLRKIEIQFLEKHKQNISEIICCNGKPFNLYDKDENVHLSVTDKKILLEGDYWGEFFKAFYEIGDLSILDIRQKSKHPRYFTYGILECDERDKKHKYGYFPNHLGKMIFPRFKNFKGKFGLDVGCGGGQFGLEAARNEADSIGIDISFESLRIALNYALSQNINNIDYIYAQPEALPFKDNIFDFILFKDSIHHFNNPEIVLGFLVNKLKSEAEMIAYEHVGNSAFIRKVLDKIQQKLIPKILRRYPNYPRHQIFSKEPPNEDIGMKNAVAAIEKYFSIEKKYGEIRFYEDIEALLYYAYGKREWFSEFFANLFYLIEKPFLPIIKPNHILMIGKKKNMRTN